VAHKRIYRGVRTVLFATTIVALVGFYTFPLAPPRLLPQYGYVDTLVKFHTGAHWPTRNWPNAPTSSPRCPACTSHGRCGAGSRSSSSPEPAWLRVLGLCYPVGTLLVIVGTANHFVLDAVGGALVLVVGFGIQFLLSGHGAYVEAPDPVESAA
jgi:hypothetical protein